MFLYPVPRRGEQKICFLLDQTDKFEPTIQVFLDIVRTAERKKG